MNNEQNVFSNFCHFLTFAKCNFYCKSAGNFDIFPCEDGGGGGVDYGDVQEDGGGGVDHGDKLEDDGPGVGMNTW